MTRDRLGSLKAAQKDDGDSDDEGVAAEVWNCKMERFFGEVEGVRADMENIRRVMAEVGVKQSVILSEPRCEERVKVRLVCAPIRLTPYGSSPVQRNSCVIVSDYGYIPLTCVLSVVHGKD